MDRDGERMFFHGNADHVKKFLMRVAWYAGLRLEFTTRVAVEGTDDDGHPVIRLRTYVTVAEVYKSAESRPALPGYDETAAALDAKQPMSETLQQRLIEVLKDPDRTIDFNPFGASRAADHDASPTDIWVPLRPQDATATDAKGWEWGPSWNEGTPAKDSNHSILRFNHELWRAWYDSNPPDPVTGNARRHDQDKSAGGDYWKDKVWTEGELPVRKQLGASTVEGE